MTPESVDGSTIQLSRTRTRRDLRVSEGLLIAGVVGTGVVLAADFLFFAQSALSASAIFALDAVQGTFEVFAVIGAIFVVVNWQLLRHRVRDSAPPVAGT